ncbi:N-terminal acetyltransferase A complex subunit nat1 [Tetrabaena socialis]|uniref:N-terminal acetyltransferase A complex subunit nat1 n=1 Tax=Tetrabaena socialis TaxID=47790 RepID=A0A2J8AEI8_9CHLO|nr:N-terminal acetyltransferase A complex subunit nat1 [Tetrabaena socialis]|eukprot:PNH10937.1 N-terminal acetyltransferase A complex subunit nat1 [Tetrabaena socialis]
MAAALGSGELSDVQRAALSALYDGLAAQYPGSSACRRIPLDFKVGESFRAALDAYLRRGLTRGVPSLYVDVRPLMADPAKRQVVQELVEGYRDSLRRWGRENETATEELQQEMMRALDHFEKCIMFVDTSKPGWEVLYTNMAWEHVTGLRVAVRAGA